MVFIFVKISRTPAGDAWRESLKLPDGVLTERVKSDDIERGFWRSRRQNSMIALDGYRLPVCDMLKQLIDCYKIDSVMELGPGWGNYTFFLAGQGIDLTCVDISPDNLDYLASELVKLPGITADMICAPWESAEIKPQAYDMAFAYNCFYRMQDIEYGLMKLNLTAKKLCVIGMNRPPELPWLPALKNELGLKVRYTRMGCEQFHKVLSQLGIEAKLVNIQNVREYRYSSMKEIIERARQHICSDFDKDALEKLLSCYHRTTPAGDLVCTYRFLSQLLVWEPKTL